MIYKRKNDKSYFFKMKNFGSSIDTIRRMKRQYTDWENNLQVTHLITNLYQDDIKEPYNSTLGKQTTQMGRVSELALHHHVSKKPRKTILKSSRYSRRSTLIS